LLKPGERQADILAMLSRVDRHFGGKYSQQIEAYRARLVNSLAERIEELEKRASQLQNVVESQRRRLEWQRGRFALRSPPRRKRSAVYQMSRAVLRPIERVGRRVRTAIGILKAS
jgi:hypothetical protein